MLHSARMPMHCLFLVVVARPLPCYHSDAVMVLGWSDCTWQCKHFGIWQAASTLLLTAAAGCFATGPSWRQPYHLPCAIQTLCRYGWGSWHHNSSTSTVCRRGAFQGAQQLAVLFACGCALGEVDTTLPDIKQANLLLQDCVFL